MYKENKHYIKGDNITVEKYIFVDGVKTNYTVASDGHVFNKKTNKEVKGTYNSKEYHCVQIRVNGKQKTFMTHRLVAEAFCENPNGYNIVDHIDRNKLNNDYTNLRWVDNSTNVLNISKKKERISTDYYQEEFDDNWKPLLISKNYYINKDGIVVNVKKRNILKGGERNGYRRVMIDRKSYSVHVLVWEAFNGKKPEGMVIDHIDGNRSNNKLSNLRLVSQSQNMNNAYVNGHKGQVKIKQYSEKGEFIKEYKSLKEAAEATNGNWSAIKQAAERRGKSGGFFWIRDKDNITIEEVLKITTSGKPKKTYMEVDQYDKNWNFIKHYSSLKEAAREIGCAGSTIKRAAEAQRLGKGFYWILKNEP